ncbi:Glycosyl hydrolase [Phytophthora megakarya]|uniref:cellulose 1,4-beta-cellobiosidase (non-reducing end) n=1 Tax=Phytophthora megakarya TaxID=4795 RepID=A0A225WSK0_9STRA|nr:Glycosyl hydrolase [Phytophthora megakarya]
MIGGMTLAMSIWVDYGSNMTWLDSYTGDDPKFPGAMRGNCPKTGGDPESVFHESPDATVKFMNIRSGDFGSMY